MWGLQHVVLNHSFYSFKCSLITFCISHMAPGARDTVVQKDSEQSIGQAVKQPDNNQAVDAALTSYGNAEKKGITSSAAGTP